MRRRLLLPAVLIVAATSSGVALAAFPGGAPVKTGQISVPAFPQAVAVDISDDTAYVVTTGPGTIVAASASLDDTISAATGASPSGVAVDSEDDTVYVVDNDSPGALFAYSPDLTLVHQQPLSRYPQAVAVHPRDDTVYVTFNVDDSLSIINGRNLDDSVNIKVGDDPYAVAVNPIDDTIYTANYNGKSASIISPDGQSVSTVSLASVGSGIYPLSVAVHPTDDTVYIAGQLERRLMVASPDFSSWTLIPLNGAFATIVDISISPDGSTIYLATNSNNNSAVAINAVDLDDSYTFTVADTPVGVDAVNGGAYFALNGQVRGLAVVTAPPSVTSVTPSSGPTAGGTAITITGSGFVAGQTTATIGGATLNASFINSSTLTATTPTGTPGPATIEVTVGSTPASPSGVFTYVPPPPPPPIPSSEPRGVIATAGDTSAVVSWSAPASSGSFPISYYQVTSSPGGRTCLAAAATTDCEVTGLVNGTAYTFTVKALTGAGWSVESAPSNTVVPRPSAGPSIVITGSREGKRIEVTGSTTGFGMGAILNPWVRLAGQTAYTRGSAQVLVSMDGTFGWGRTTGKKVSVYMQSPDGSARSNTVTIR